ncbi:DUF6058 family natural product biosynthesis protein [Pseudoalteromonas sp. 1_2015MBL_MicDiv]|uniref:DUF6058 family natural product biosynthesis protein n=1 Tax=Pseudoalteromonas sp. 1_2015MBL_MicDiv TaxID=1720343 RepID=UPI000BBE08CC|nr:DUF6058 family natural product biosynthesis protein [Pseudoalteromonas sp. 1_2015MBL_MicDiv]ATG79658.1 hypothetical protein AOR04_19090 [Pseudoalteromonas sp. 1_2015MBL_MicDiv]
MELIKYLNEHFFTKQELLDISKVTERDLVKYQENGMMPKCSYKLSLNLKSDSFFGLHNDEQEIEYYAKGYASWLAIIQSLNSTEAIYSVFASRYQLAIENLKQQGHSSSNPKIASEFNTHIKEEWSHFLNGIYGLCTKSGLPEDIAAKEFSILEINELSEIGELSTEQTNKLTIAVNLLDSASSLFAPHERLKSSRHRLVNEIRRKYKLKS